MIEDPFVEYRRSGDRSLRNRLVEEHRDLARVIALRYTGRGEPTDDLVQVALIGLLKAVERFDPERGVPFSGFAGPTIEGELKRHFRDKTWAVRVPRRLQELRVEVRRAAERLEQRHGRSPTVAEIARELGESSERVLEAMSASAAYRSASLDAAGPGDEPALAERLADATHADQAELHVLVRQLLATLPERDAEIVRLRFDEELTQAEIAARVGISQMHVSRLLRRALLALRAQLDGPPDAPAP